MENINAVLINDGIPQNESQTSPKLMNGFPPADNETDTGGKQPRTQPAVEPGDERIRDLRDTAKGDAQGNHEGNDQIPLDAECLENGSPGLRQGEYALRVFADDAGEHEPKPRKHQGRQHKIPPVHVRKHQVILYAGKQYLDSDGAPEEAIDKNQVLGGNL